MTEEKPKSKKINDLEALLTLTKSTNYAIPILDLNDRDADGDPKLKQVPINLLQSLFKTETNLHKVATTGKYSDLKNLPQLFSGNYADLQGKPDLSQFLTQHQDISGKADKWEITPVADILRQTSTYPHGSTPIVFADDSFQITTNSEGTWREEYYHNTEHPTSKLMWQIATNKYLIPRNQVFKSDKELLPKFSRHFSGLLIAIVKKYADSSSSPIIETCVISGGYALNNGRIHFRWKDGTPENPGFLSFENLDSSTTYSISLAGVFSNKAWYFLSSSEEEGYQSGYYVEQ